MVELGFPMTASTQGSPYSVNDLAMILQRMMGVTEDQNAGVVEDYLDELTVTFAGSTIHVSSGAACVGGFVQPFHNDVSLAVDIPDSGTTGKRVILRVTWDSPKSNDIQIERLILSSADGTATLPILVQSFDTIWEISLASFTIDTNGTISALTDERTYCTHAEWLSSFSKSNVVAFGTVVGSTLQAGGRGIASAAVDDISGVNYRIQLTLEAGVTGSTAMSISSSGDFRLSEPYSDIRTSGLPSDNLTVHILVFG